MTNRKEIAWAEFLESGALATNEYPLNLSKAYFRAGFNARNSEVEELVDAIGNVAKVKNSEIALIAKKYAKLEAENLTLKEQLREAVEVIEFYGDIEKMYDTAKNSDGSVLAYVRGIDQYSEDDDLEKIEGMRTLHHGKLARHFLAKIKTVEGIDDL